MSKYTINNTGIVVRRRKNCCNGEVGGGTPKLLQVVPCPIGGPE